VAGIEKARDSEMFLPRIKGKTGRIGWVRKAGGQETAVGKVRKETNRWRRVAVQNVPTSTREKLLIVVCIGVESNGERGSPYPRAWGGRESRQTDDKKKSHRLNFKEEGCIRAKSQGNSSKLAGSGCVSKGPHN